MSLRTFDHGTVMWMPLAGRIDAGCAPSSSARTSSAHTPAAFTTTRARTRISSPSASTARADDAVAVLHDAPHRARSSAIAAPWTAAVRAMVSVSRASSACAS